MAEPKKLTPPFTDADIEALTAGDVVLLTGVIYTARDTAHKRMMATLKEGGELPFDVAGQV
ncbi:hypothetical protein MNBD_DELTA02-481, partial [hydrothermal vent metagenome]